MCFTCRLYEGAKTPEIFVYSPPRYASWSSCVHLVFVLYKYQTCKSLIVTSKVDSSIFLLATLDLTDLCQYFCLALRKNY